MTLETLASPRRRTIPATAVVLAVISAVLLVLSVLLFVTGRGKVLTIDLVDAGSTATTLVPADRVGLIPAACATVDPSAFPCPQMPMVAVRS